MSNQIKIEYVDIKILKLADYNPRVMDDETRSKLEKGLTEFGMVEPLVVNKDNVVIGGHQRLTAAKNLGWKEVPVVYIELDKNKEKLLNLALNKLIGDWDQEKLGKLVSQISALDIDTDLTGFEDIELNQILNTQEFDLFDVNDDINKMGVEEIEDKLGHQERVPLCFWAENKEQYDIVHNYFQTTRKKNLDIEKLIKLIEKNKNEE